MIPHSRDLFSAEGLIFVVKSVTVPLEEVNVISIRYGLGSEKVFAKLGVVVLNWTTILAKLSKGRNEVHYIGGVTEFTIQSRANFGP